MKDITVGEYHRLIDRITLLTAQPCLNCGCPDKDEFHNCNDCRGS